MSDIKTPDLLDAQAMGKKYPETFFVPSAEDMDALKVGDAVKVGVDGERFWCILVRRAEDGDWVGKVANDLVLTSEHGIARDDLLKFSAKHLHDIDN